MAQKYKIKRIANIKAPDGAEAVFHEIWDVIDVNGEECVHRNHDRAFKTEAEAQAWINQQRT